MSLSFFMSGVEQKRVSNCLLLIQSNVDATKRIFYCEHLWSNQFKWRSGGNKDDLLFAGMIKKYLIFSTRTALHHRKLHHLSADTELLLWKKITNFIYEYRKNAPLISFHFRFGFIRNIFFALVEFLIELRTWIQFGLIRELTTEKGFFDFGLKSSST